MSFAKGVVTGSAWLLCACIGLTLAGCGGSDPKPEEKQSQAGTPAGARMISLEDPDPGNPANNQAEYLNASAQPAGLRETQTGESVRPANGNQTRTFPDKNDQLDSSSASEGLKAVNQWHRATLENRPQVLSTLDLPQAQALRDFQAIWDGKAAAYRADLRIELPDALGPEFQRLARAFAQGGADSLGQALRSGSGPIWLAWLEVYAFTSADEQQHEKASRALGSLLRGMLDAGYDRERILTLRDKIWSVARYANSFLPFQKYEVRSGDNLINIAYDFSKPGAGIRHGWIQAFNDKASDTIRVGEELLIPKQILHMEIWRGQRIGALYAGNYILRLYAVSVGRHGADETPLGQFTIEIHDPKPIWYRDDGPNLPYGNPDNPLGERWLGFKEKTSYGLHGTNSEESIGTYETQGCVRFHNVDIVELFDLLPVGTKILIHA